MAVPTPISAPSELFKGYDSISEGWLNTAATGKVVNVSGARSTLCIKVCTSTEELASAMDIDASLSVSYMIVNSATAKMNFVKKLNVTSTCVCILVYAHHGIGTYSAEDLAWRNDVKVPANAADASKFVYSYGDSVVVSATVGGEYYGVYMFHTETRTEQNELVASLQAKGIHGGISVDAAAETKLSDFLNTSHVSWSYEQNASGIIHPSLPKPENFINFAVEFTSLALDAPEVIGFTVMGYERFVGMKEIFHQVAMNRRYFLGSGDTGGLLRDLTQLLSIKHDIDELKKIYEVYNYSEDVGLINFGKDVQKEIKSIDEQRFIYADDPGTVKLKSLTLSTLKTKPTLQFNEVQAPSWGGTRGQAYDFDVNISLRNHVKLQSIRLRADEFVHCIKLVYSWRNGIYPLQVHGGEYGNEAPELNLNNCFIMRISGAMGALVDKLCVELTDHRSTSLGGSGGSSTFEWSPPSKSFVVGFRGRSSTLLDMIQPVVVELLPAILRTDIL